MSAVGRTAECKGSFEESLVEDVILDVFMDESLKTYDKQHPGVNHRGLFVQDELADQYDDEHGLIMKRLIGIHTRMTLAVTSARGRL